jgi:hypothetical protein
MNNILLLLSFLMYVIISAFYTVLLRCEHAYIFMPLCYIEEFLATTDESNEEPVSKHSPKSGEIICKHKDKGFEHFAHGLCEKCYNKVVLIYNAHNTLTCRLDYIFF